MRKSQNDYKFLFLDVPFVCRSAKRNFILFPLLVLCAITRMPLTFIHVHNYLLQLRKWDFFALFFLLVIFDFQFIFYSSHMKILSFARFVNVLNWRIGFRQSTCNAFSFVVCRFLIIIFCFRTLSVCK